MSSCNRVAVKNHMRACYPCEVCRLVKFGAVFFCQRSNYCAFSFFNGNFAIERFDSMRSQLSTHAIKMHTHSYWNLSYKCVNAFSTAIYRFPFREMCIISIYFHCKWAPKCILSSLFEIFIENAILEWLFFHKFNSKPLNWYGLMHFMCSLN